MFCEPKTRQNIITVKTIVFIYIKLTFIKYPTNRWTNDLELWLIIGNNRNRMPQTKSCFQSLKFKLGWFGVYGDKTFGESIWTAVPDPTYSEDSCCFNLQFLCSVFLDYVFCFVFLDIVFSFLRITTSCCPFSIFKLFCVILDDEFHIVFTYCNLCNNQII